MEKLSDGWHRPLCPREIRISHQNVCSSSIYAIERSIQRTGSPEICVFTEFAGTKSSEEGPEIVHITTPNLGYVGFELRPPLGGGRGVALIWANTPGIGIEVKLVEPCDMPEGINDCILAEVQVTGAAPFHLIGCYNALSGPHRDDYKRLLHKLHQGWTTASGRELKYDLRSTVIIGDLNTPIRTGLYSGMAVDVNGEPILRLKTPWSPTHVRGNCLDVALAGPELNCQGAIIADPTCRDHVPIVLRVEPPLAVADHPQRKPQTRLPRGPRTKREVALYRHLYCRELEKLADLRSKCIHANQLAATAQL